MCVLHVLHVLQVLRYFDYVFTGVFTFEMIIKVSDGHVPFSTLKVINPLAFPGALRDALIRI